MGSLRDETRGFGKEDVEHLPEDAVLERPVVGTNQESAGGVSGQTDPLHNTSHADDESCTNQESAGGVSGQTDSLHNTSHADEESFVETKDESQSGQDVEHTDAPPMLDGTTATERLLHCGDETIENVSEDNTLFPLPSTVDPNDPNSPAPFGQHHMRTQVSLEVVQCHSIATSPMTPPGGGNSFIFPSSLRKSGTVVHSDAQDAEPQAGRQVEFCSVATSPMTPKTPSVTAFPVLTGRAQITATAKSPAEAQSDDVINSDASPEISACSAAAESQLEDSNQQCQQQWMGSMDQDITILVTHYDNKEACYPVTPEMVKIEEIHNTEEKASEGPDQGQNTTSTKPSLSKVQSSEAEGEQTPLTVKLNKMEQKAAPKSPVPESPAPVGFHNIRTQVSLEVVQCHSVATSPMTPPEGDHAFHFPSPSGVQIKDGEMQVGQQPEFRSVATAPMTPRTPTVTTFPEIRKEASVGENIGEEEEGEKEATEEEENDCKEKSEEVVQEVSWDDKGMTWEVYGAVVEVAVLGSAIQKHLEKQVKKQKSSLPPPPPLNPSAMPLTPEAVQGYGSRAAQRGERDDKHFRLEHETMATSSPSPGC
ncbi:G protein-regulated inducer of neurite outgrowth 1 isoform X2 [Entelurus aequoreus]|uniref:G protein-regulated inducer of neurite outgrowth 1 isoform X2 n=1 Tax=Entelurus aequoreus TaxID=161455 RepID=UPI002B1D12DC|nr:G protein-regulated inducer of neurite outgrowth 1 isoform X2 [Entelurus aequoreus]